MQSKGRTSTLILEDKNIYGINKVHKNVLKPAEKPLLGKSKIYYDPLVDNEENNMAIKGTMMDFVADGLKFDPTFVKNKCAHATPYSPKAQAKEIFENKHQLGSDYVIEEKKFRPFFNGQDFEPVKQEAAVAKKSTDADMWLVPYNKDELVRVPEAQVLFKPKAYFKTIEQVNYTDPTAHVIDVEPEEKPKVKGKKQTSFFLTQSHDVNAEPSLKKSVSTNSVAARGDLTARQEKPPKTAESQTIKSLNLEIPARETPKQKDWDEYLIDLLSENTARWIVLKKTSDDKQKQALLKIVEKKFGKYTRDIQDLELVEDELTDYEKRKIEEEKRRLEQEKESELRSMQASIDEEDSENRADESLPPYRLPLGLKREYLKKARVPDSSYNKSARNLMGDSSIMIEEDTFQKSMSKRNATEMTVFQTQQPYTNELLKGQAKHVYSNDPTKIVLENGKTFSKSLQTVYPIEFTNWIDSIDLHPVDKPQLKRPTKGRKKWTKFPKEVINGGMIEPKRSEDDITDYWHLMNSAPDTHLKKILKYNKTVDKAVEEWRRKWQTGSRWSMAEIEHLIKDLRNNLASIRYQAVVVCTRAVEQMGLMAEKIKSYYEHNVPEIGEDENSEEAQMARELKYSFKKLSDFEDGQNIDRAYSQKLFKAIESLLNDTNDKVRLAAAIAIFTILRRFTRPMNEIYETAFINAERALRESLKSHLNSDRYAAAQCLGMYGYCDQDIVKILLSNYFDSSDQITREQVISTLSDLSRHTDLINQMVEEYLSHDYARERILACKIFPCLRRTINMSATTKLISLMWNDNNRSVKKIAAQTLGRTGRGQYVHEEILKRLQSPNVYDRVEALNRIYYLGIMTGKLVDSFVKCFRDEYITVRSLACKAAQGLFEKDERVIDALVFMARYDQVPKLKTSAIHTLGLIGDFNSNIRRCLLWALQYELDPMIRTEACHSIVLLVKKADDPELIDILHERHLIEKEPLVQKEIKDALDYFGYDPERDIPIVAKIKADVMKFNDKNRILKKILENEKQANFDEDKRRFLWLVEPKDKNVDEPAAREFAGESLVFTIRELKNAKKAKIKFKRRPRNFPKRSLNPNQTARKEPPRPRPRSAEPKASKPIVSQPASRPKKRFNSTEKLNSTQPGVEQPSLRANFKRLVEKYAMKNKQPETQVFAKVSTSESSPPSSKPSKLSSEQNSNFLSKLISE